MIIKEDVVYFFNSSEDMLQFFKDAEKQGFKIDWEFVKSFEKEYWMSVNITKTSMEVYTPYGLCYTGGKVCCSYEPDKLFKGEEWARF